MSEPKAPFIRRVKLTNYKSIRECDVALGPLNLLVGPNGSGKSNFLDALRFVKDALWDTLEYAFRRRGGMREVAHWAPTPAGEFSIALSLALPDGGDAEYAIRLEGNPEKAFWVSEESCRVLRAGVPPVEYVVRSGQVERASFSPPPASADRLYLTIASNYPEFRGLYDFLKGMRFYNIDPAQIRKEPFPGTASQTLALTASGEGAVFAFHRLPQQARQRLQEYLHAIIPDLTRVSLRTARVAAFRGDDAEPRSTLMPDEPLWIRFELQSGDRPLGFRALHMSDGTLRAFGILLALFQCVERPLHDPVPLVGIEEPEATIHPAAAAVLMDALQEATLFTQVLVTTHSPDLLDTPDLDPGALLSVEMINGESVIGPIDAASRSILRDQLATAGELLRQNQLTPAPQAPGSASLEALGRSGPSTHGE